MTKLILNTAMFCCLPKTKFIVVSAVPAPAVDFTCNGNPVEQGYHGQILRTSPPSTRLHCAPYHANQSKGWWSLGGCSAASFIGAVWQHHQPAFAFVSMLSWCLSYNLGVRSGVCIALTLLLLTMLVLHCSAGMITASDHFPVFCHPLLACFY